MRVPVSTVPPEGLPVSVMKMAARPVTERKSETDDRRSADRAHVNGARVDDRSGLINDRRRLDDDGLLNHDGLGDGGVLDRLLDNDRLGLDLLHDDGRWLLYHDRSGIDVNGRGLVDDGARFQCSRDEKSGAHSGHNLTRGCPSSITPCIGARSSGAKKSQGCYCYQGLFHIFRLFCWLGRTRC